MLSSGAHAIQDRKNRRAAVKRAAMSSRVSLLSGVTASSSGSSGSGSTITQESLSRPRVRSSKDNANSKGKRQRASASGPSTKGWDSPRKSKGVIDVFAFLEKDQSRASLVQQRNKSGLCDHNDTKYPTHEDSDLDSNPRSFHSDSGISLNDVSSDHDSSKVDRAFKGRLHTLQEERASRHYNPTNSEHRYQAKLQPFPQEVDEDHPEWYYWTKGMRDETCIPGPIDLNAGSANTAQPKPSGYDLLASYLSSSEMSAEDSLPPIYRRFGNLNHRILLQLQDEIVEMEEDLQHMDRADAYQRATKQGEAAPASRRLDWQWRGSELHARRLELLGRIYLKVEQYNQALASFQRVASSTFPATLEDVGRYHKWMVENKPIAEAESTFLDQQNDLLSLTQQKPDSSHKSPAPPPPTTLMMAITPATALPILLFRIIPGFSSRLTVVLLLAPSVAIISKLQAAGSFFDERESRHFLFMYFGVLILAALLI